jgi:hypothetical protein
MSNQTVQAVEIDPNGHVCFEAVLQKSNLSLLEANYNIFVNDEKRFLSTLLNDQLKFKYVFGDANQSNLIALTINFETCDLSRTQKYLFQSPVNVCLINDFQKITSASTHASVYYANIALRFNFTMNNSDLNDSKMVVFKISNKIKYCLTGDSFERDFKVTVKISCN